MNKYVLQTNSPNLDILVVLDSDSGLFSYSSKIQNNELGGRRGMKMIYLANYSLLLLG